MRKFHVKARLEPPGDLQQGYDKLVGRQVIDEGFLVDDYILGWRQYNDNKSRYITVPKEHQQILDGRITEKGASFLQV
jgi:hypothetical protein